MGIGSRWTSSCRHQATVTQPHGTDGSTHRWTRHWISSRGRRRPRFPALFIGQRRGRLSCCWKKSGIGIVKLAANWVAWEASVGYDAAMTSSTTTRYAGHLFEAEADPASGLAIAA